MIENYQSRILAANEIVDYASEVMVSNRPEVIQFDPMVGFKILMKDLNAFSMPQNQRFQQIEQNLGFLSGTGCIIRETNPREAVDGFWLISFPVPLSLINMQITNIMRVLSILKNSFGIVSLDLIEINVSGRCPLNEVEFRFARVAIPPEIRNYMVEPNNTPYKLGHIVRINDNYAMLRTMWDWRSQTNKQSRSSDLIVIPQLIANMFR